MAFCKSCNKDVGCACNLSNGLCIDCRKKQETTKQVKQAEVVIKIPKQ